MRRFTRWSETLKLLLFQNYRGDGTIEIRHILNKDELMGHASMYAHVIIPAHASIGFHQHVENTEPYYVQKRNL